MGSLFCTARFLLEPDRVLRDRDLIALGRLPRLRGLGLPALALGLRFLLLSLRLRLGLMLVTLPLVVDLLLAPLGLHLGLEPTALQLGLGLLVRELCLAFALARLACVLGGFGLRLRLGLLQAALAGEVLLVGGCAEGLLGLADKLADKTSGDALTWRALRMLMLGQFRVRAPLLPVVAGIRPQLPSRFGLPRGPAHEKRMFGSSYDKAGSAAMHAGDAPQACVSAAARSVTTTASVWGSFCRLREHDSGAKAFRGWFACNDR